MPQAKYTRDEVAARGAEIYLRNIRPLVEPGNDGKFVAVDIESGDFEVDSRDLPALERLLARRPHAVVYSLRIGRKFVHRLGGISAKGA